MDSWNHLIPASADTHKVKVLLYYLGNVYKLILHPIEDRHDENWLIGRKVYKLEIKHGPKTECWKPMAQRPRSCIKAKSIFKGLIVSFSGRICLKEVSLIVYVMIQLRRFRNEDTREVASLMHKTFKRYNSKDYFKKSSVKEFIDYFDPEKNPLPRLIRRFRNTPIFFVAEQEGMIVGTIKGKPIRIFSLYVEDKCQGQGIGRLLVNRFESEARKRGSKAISVRAALYAVQFYEKMGFRKTAEVRGYYGMKQQPMIKELD